MRNQHSFDDAQGRPSELLRPSGESARGAGSAGADGGGERGVGPQKHSTTTKSRVELQALGRLKTGTLNKTEQAYATLLKDWQQSGIVAWYKFEGLKLRLADNTFYTPDFAVMLANGQMEMHEVKGFWQDDARAKIKIAADMYPFRFVAVRPKPKKDGGGWATEDF